MKSALDTTNLLFRAFADATRLRVLNLLTEGEVCVCDLCDVLGVLQPKVSRHLAYLRRAGLVRVRREGKWKHYALIEAPSGLSATLLGCIRTCLSNVELLKKDRERLRRVRGRSCCAKPATTRRIHGCGQC